MNLADRLNGSESKENPENALRYMHLPSLQVGPMILTSPAQGIVRMYLDHSILPDETQQLLKTMQARYWVGDINGWIEVYKTKEQMERRKGEKVIRFNSPKDVREYIKRKFHSPLPAEYEEQSQSTLDLIVENRASPPGTMPPEGFYSMKLHFTAEELHHIAWYAHMAMQPEYIINNLREHIKTGNADKTIEPLLRLAQTHGHEKQQEGSIRMKLWNTLFPRRYK